MEKLSDANVIRLGMAAGYVAMAATLVGYPGQGSLGANWEARLMRISEEIQDAVVSGELGEEGAFDGCALIV